MTLLRIPEASSLGNLMAESADLSWYQHIVVRKLTGTNSEEMEYKHGWCGEENDPKYMLVSSLKSLELLTSRNTPDQIGQILLTPVLPFGSGWQGGIKRIWSDGTDVYEIVTSISALTQRCDLLVALIINLAVTEKVILHHFGFRHETQNKMIEAVERNQKTYGKAAIQVPADDHARSYILIENPDGKYWKEEQWYYNKPRFNTPWKPRSHWDLIVNNPLEFLSFMGVVLGQKPETWEAGKDDPVGALWEENRENSSLGVMPRAQRPTWDTSEQ